MRLDALVMFHAPAIIIIAFDSESDKFVDADIKLMQMIYRVCQIREKMKLSNFKGSKIFTNLSARPRHKNF